MCEVYTKYLTIDRNAVETKDIHLLAHFKDVDKLIEHLQKGVKQSEEKVCGVFDIKFYHFSGKGAVKSTLFKVFSSLEFFFCLFETHPNCCHKFKTSN